MSGVWSARELTARPVDEWDHRAGVYVTARSAWMGPELVRSLAYWLLHVVGDRPAPSDPDRVRAAIDEQRQALRERSSSAGTTEDFRAGLAWCDRALDAIAAATDPPDGSPS